MTWLFSICLILNLADAIGTWVTVVALRCAEEVNPVMLAGVHAMGWTMTLSLKVLIATGALSVLYFRRHENPVAVKRIFIFLLVVFSILVLSQTYALVLFLTF